MWSVDLPWLLRHGKIASPLTEGLMQVRIQPNCNCHFQAALGARWHLWPRMPRPLPVGQCSAWRSLLGAHGAAKHAGGLSLWLAGPGRRRTPGGKSLAKPPGPPRPVQAQCTASATRRARGAPGHVLYSEASAIGPGVTSNPRLSADYSTRLGYAFSTRLPDRCTTLSSLCQLYCTRL